MSDRGGSNWMGMDADVVVIGAGAAGLAAARTLARGSLRVIVLEARDREGGRVWSEATARDRAPVELGAEFIHGPAPETLKLLGDAGTASVDTAGEAWECGDDGELHRADDNEFLSAAGIFEGARALAHDESVDRFLRRFDGDIAKQSDARAARLFVEGF